MVRTAAFGDGCYIPERAFRKFPEIPAQRAVLAWKDGLRRSSSRRPSIRRPSGSDG